MNKLTRLFLLLALLSSTAVASLPAHAESAQLQSFDIWEYRVEGNTLLDSKLVESAMYAYLGPDKNIDSIETARDFLQQLYKQHGYPIVVVKIPEQNVIGGVVRLQVIEGKIDRTRISGNQYFSRREMREEVPSLTRGYPLDMASVRQEIDELNRRSPYRSVTPVIRPGRYPGTMEMELKVRDQLPAWVFMEANNRHSALTTDNRASFSMGYDNLWQKHHSISLAYTTSPEDTEQTSVWNLSYAFPWSARSRIALFAMDSNSRTGYASSGDQVLVEGLGTMVGVRDAITLNGTASFNHILVLGMDYKDFEENVTVSNPEDSAQIPIPISYLAFSVSYNVNTRGESSSNQYGISTNFGVRGLGNKEEEFDYKRYLSRANYFYLGASYRNNYFFNNKWRLASGLRGQYTESALISNEQLSAGGVSSVRGYTESVALGDYGLIASLELFYQPKLKARWMQDIFFSTYLDGSRLYIHDSLSEDAAGNVQDRYELLGAGIGFGMTAMKNMSLGVYYAKALKDLDQDNFSNNPMLHFSLSAKF